MRRTLSFSKILSFTLAAILALSFAPVPAYASDGDKFDANGIMYQVISEEAKTVRVTGISPGFDYDAVSGSVTVPQAVFNDAGTEYQVVEIGDYSFGGNNSLVDIDLPGSIKAIGEGAFSGCNALERLKIPDAVTDVSKYMVTNCENLREIVLPSSLSFIDTRELFSECPGLESISIANNPKFYSVDGVLYGHISIYTEDYKGNVIFDREMVALVKYPVAKPGPFTIPDGVEVIGQYAFMYTNVAKQLVVPASVLLIEPGAFSYWANLESIIFRGETPPFIPSNILNNAGINGLIVFVPEGSVEAYKTAFRNSKPGGAVTYEEVPASKDSDNPGGNDPGGNPGGNDPGGNDPGGSTGGDNNPGGNNPGSNTGGNTGPAWPVGGSGTDYGSTRATSDYRSLQGLLTSAIQAANAANSGEASLRLLNYKSLDHDTLKQLAAAAKASGKRCVVHVDTVEGNVVQVRVMFNPANAAKTMHLSGSVNSTGARNIDALFERNFQNKVVVVELAQQGDFGMTVSIAARVNLAGFNTKTLYIYVYDKTKNLYTRIKNPRSRIDKNGYLWFDTQLSGYVIITDKPLRIKG